MSLLSLVTPTTPERLAREFDDRGPEACVTEVINDLKQHNPELLDMAVKCAKSRGDYSRVMQDLGMFYRLILAPSLPDRAGSELNPLPRMTPRTRDLIVAQIDELGPEVFTMNAVTELETQNPELLQMAHNFASTQPDYLEVMQGFALVYKSLVDQAAADRALLH
ncbi:MAG: hypothetical protein QOD93_1475 [Acetobacteraceae bacterium]|nr:hypothetical protein [Acetobacteraceae bacterium]